MKYISIKLLMTIGLGFTETGFRAYASRILKEMVKAGTLPSTVDIKADSIPSEHGLAVLNALGKGKERLALVAGAIEMLNNGDFSTDEFVGATSKEKKGSLAQLREFVESKGLTAEFLASVNK